MDASNFHKRQRIDEEGHSNALKPFYHASFYQTQPIAALPRVKYMRPSISSAAPYKEFYTQRECFEFIDSCSATMQRRLLCFSEEIAEGGKRKYIATSKERMLDKVLETPPSLRHFYEIIREQRGCYLYFDLEFNVQANPDKDGEVMVDQLIQVVSEQMLKIYKIKITHEHILELDSSTPSKFSRHLVFNIKRCCWKDSSHVNAFVHHLIEGILQKDQSFVVKKSQTHKQVDGSSEIEHQDQPILSNDLFVDTSVYSRNRAFRLFFSSKMGKTAVLMPTHRRGPFHTSSDAQSDRQRADRDLFFALLISNVDPDPARIFTAYDESDLEQCGRFRGRWKDPQAAGEHGSRPASSLLHHHYEPSPHPLLDEFIEKVCARHVNDSSHLLKEAVAGTRRFIRSWARVSPTSIIFNIQGHRFCERIGREHKSNGIFYQVDIKEGSWHQRCYDRDCSHYRSPSLPLPFNIWNQLKPET